jgi:hypothetical protein
VAGKGPRVDPGDCSDPLPAQQRRQLAACSTTAAVAVATTRARSQGCSD